MKSNPSLDLRQTMALIESERAQIGHEIHDGILPLIFAASATVSRLLEDQAADGPAADRSADSPSSASARQGEECERKLRQVSQWLGDAMQAGRQLLTGVYPPELVDASWTKAAEDTLQRLFPTEHPCVRWQVDPRVNEISAPVAFAAYRITVEAVRNAIGHGGATQVEIEAQLSSGLLSVRVRDNGCGFDPSKVADDRFGIRSMRGRARLVGGDLQIQSTPGGPTDVAFTAPAAQQSDPAGPPAQDEQR